MEKNDNEVRTVLDDIKSTSDNDGKWDMPQEVIDSITGQVVSHGAVKIIESDTHNDKVDLFEKNFFNSELYRKIKEICEKELDKKHVAVVDQGLLSNEEFKKHMDYYEALMKSDKLPKNFTFAFTGKKELFEKDVEIPQELINRFKPIDFGNNGIHPQR